MRQLFNLLFLLSFGCLGQNSYKSLDIAKEFSRTIENTYPDSIVVKKFVQHLIQDKQVTDPSKRPASWNYEEAVVLRGFENLWKYTGNNSYYDYMNKIVSHFINADGSIRTYQRNDYNSDQITGGLQLITLYRQTKDQKYKIAADILREQIAWQPRTKSGGFWHKHKYPYQMWLDCMYMMNVYYAEYCHYFNTPSYFDDVANQFILLNKYAKDPKTGLLRHGWDESKTQNWADKSTGQSPEVWARSMGWYIMALVETLQIFPKNHPKRPQLIKILNETVTVLLKYQDKNSGVWYQIVDKGGQSGNYLEASGSTMFCYAITKACNLKLIDGKYLQNAKIALEGILSEFITKDNQGYYHIHHSCSGAGLGGIPYRSGTYEYYINEPQRSDDLKTIGPLINLFIEMDKIGYHPKSQIKIQP